MKTRIDELGNIDRAIPPAADRTGVLMIARTTATHPCRYNALK